MADVGPSAKPRPARSRWALDLAATIALATYSFIAALGFGRVFGDWEFVGDSLIIVIVGHGLSLVLRWLRVPGVIAVAVMLLALVWTVGFLHYGSTYTALFPTTGTWDVASADLSLVREQFRFAVAPVEYVGGWALLASVGTAFVVFTSDTFAFRANARGEALVPGAVLFVVVAALGADVSRMGFALALVASGFLAAVLLRARAGAAVADDPRASAESALDRPPGGPSPLAGWSCWRPGSSVRASRAPTMIRSSTRATSAAVSRRSSARSSTSGRGSSTGRLRSCSS